MSDPGGTHVNHAREKRFIPWTLHRLEAYATLALRSVERRLKSTAASSTNPRQPRGRANNPRDKFSDLSEKLGDRLLSRAIALLGKPGGRDHLAEGNSAIIRWHPLMPVRPKPCRSQ
jgi:hypothetical protein